MQHLGLDPDKYEGDDVAEKVQSYPKWKYHKTLPPRVVNNGEEEARMASLGEWFDTPASVAESIANEAVKTTAPVDPDRQAAELGADQTLVPEKKRPGRPSKKNLQGNGEGEAEDFTKRTQEDQEKNIDQLPVEARVKVGDDLVEPDVTVPDETEDDEQTTDLVEAKKYKYKGH